MSDQPDAARRGEEPLTDDPAAAMERLKDFARKILAVPKSELDAKIAEQKAGKPKRGPGRKSA